MTPKGRPELAVVPDAEDRSAAASGVGQVRRSGPSSLTRDMNRETRTDVKAPPMRSGAASSTGKIATAPGGQRSCRACGIELRQGLTRTGRLARWPVQCDDCRPVKQRFYRGPRLARVCPVCQTSFLTGYVRQVYCAARCQWSASRRRPAAIARERARRRRDLSPRVSDGR